MRECRLPVTHARSSRITRASRLAPPHAPLPPMMRACLPPIARACLSWSARGCRSPIARAWLPPMKRACPSPAAHACLPNDAYASVSTEPSFDPASVEERNADTERRLTMVVVDEVLAITREHLQVT